METPVAFVKAVSGELVKGGVFKCLEYGGYTSTGPLRVVAASEPVTTIRLETQTVGCYGNLSIAVSATDVLNCTATVYNNNHQTAFFYDAYNGNVNRNYDSYGLFASSRYAGEVVVELHIRGNTLTFSVNGVLQTGSWEIPDTYHVLVCTYGPGGTASIARL